MQFQTGIGTASEPHRTLVLFGTGNAGTAGITKKAGIGTAGTAKTVGTLRIAETAGIGTAGTAGIVVPKKLESPMLKFNLKPKPFKTAVLFYAV